MGFLASLFGGSKEGQPPTTEDKFKDEQAREGELADDRGAGQRDAMAEQKKEEEINVPLEEIEKPL